MRHLTTEELVDLAERTRAESSVPHLASCESCRRQVAELRAMLCAAGDVDVPEPSPVFWEQLAGRVRRGVDAERVRASGRQRWQIASLVAAGVVATVVIMVVVNRNVPPHPFLAADVETARIEPLGAADDPSLVLVADLAATLDWADIAEVPLAIHVGGADEAVADLSGGELRQLHALLEDQLQ